jgi:hypothetical protein
LGNGQRFEGYAMAFIKKEMIDRLRQKGYDDTGILDLAIAVADANMWTRIYRLFGLDAGLYPHGNSAA